MNLDKISGSKYLAAADVGEAGWVLTIKGFDMVSMDDGRQRLMMDFVEAKPMLVNRVNINRLKAIFKDANTETMVGKKVLVYLDPMVEFQGKIVGGLRIRPATGPAGGSQEPPKGRDKAQEVPKPLDDDIPF